MRILLDKILKIKVGCPPNFFSKLKNIHIDHEENVKKIKKNPGTGPVPGPKVIFTTICTLKNTLRPGTGPMPEFFLNFFYIFFMVYM